MLQDLCKKLDAFDAKYGVISVQRQPALTPATPTVRSGQPSKSRQLEVPATTMRTPTRCAKAGPSNHKPQVQDTMQVNEDLAQQLQRLFNEEAQFWQLDEAGSDNDASSDDHLGSLMQEDSDGDEYVDSGDIKGKGKAKAQPKRKGKGKMPAGVKERETGKGGAGAGKDTKGSSKVRRQVEATDEIHEPLCECCMEKKLICRVDANGGACGPCKHWKTKCSLAPLHKPTVWHPRPAN